MDGAAASAETLSEVATDSRIARRRMTLSALAVVVAFGATFAIGAVTKKHTGQQTASQLAPATNVQGTHTVPVTAVSANATIPDLKSPPPKHKPPKQTTSTSPSTSSVTPTPPSTPSSPGNVGSQGGGGTIGRWQHDRRRRDDGGGGTTGGGTVGGGAVSGGGST